MLLLGLRNAEDEGEGVPDAARESIFLPFEQAEVIEHSPGTGVGLYLVARFTELHGGVPG